MLQKSRILIIITAILILSTIGCGADNPAVETGNAQAQTTLIPQVSGKQVQAFYLDFARAATLQTAEARPVRLFYQPDLRKVMTIILA